jgi:hypothetical protein
MAHLDTPARLEVLQQISGAYEPEASELARSRRAGASGLLAFVSLSRLVDGTGTLTDARSGVEAAGGRHPMRSSA